MFKYHPIFVSTLFAFELEPPALAQVQEFLRTQNIEPSITEHGHDWYHRGIMNRREIIQGVYAVRDAANK